ncbi:hypothetical protein C8Q78DRAFT_1077587 [Trametes maxima]|nr:hypothetical protein C8Q78DRAFT_1077587 [Trametes maxima]
MPRLLKRAFYEILSNQSFWTDLRQDRADIPLGDADIKKLTDMDDNLREWWFRHVKIPRYRVEAEMRERQENVEGGHPR